MRGCLFSLVLLLVCASGVRTFGNFRLRPVQQLVRKGKVGVLYATPVVVCHLLCTWLIRISTYAALPYTPQHDANPTHTYIPLLPSCAPTTMLRQSVDRMSMRLDVLFVLHASFGLLSGFVCCLLPHWLDTMILFHGESISAASPETVGMVSAELHFQVHTLIRLYGVGMIMQAYQVWRTRVTDDAYIRRTFVQSFCFASLITMLILVHGQLWTPHFHVLNWLNIAIFAGLTAAYGYFLSAKPMSAYETQSKQQV